MASKRKRRDKEAGRRAASARLAAALQRANARAAAAAEAPGPTGSAGSVEVDAHIYHQTTLVLLPDGTQRAVFHLVESSGAGVSLDSDPGEVTAVEGTILRYTDPIDPPFSREDLGTDWYDRWSESEAITNARWHDVTGPAERAMFRDVDVLAFVTT